MTTITEQNMASLTQDEIVRVLRMAQEQIDTMRPYCGIEAYETVAALRQMLADELTRVGALSVLVTYVDDNQFYALFTDEQYDPPTRGGNIARVLAALRKKPTGGGNIAVHRAMSEAAGCR